MSKRAIPHSSILRSAALLISLLVPAAAGAAPSTWGYASAPVAASDAPTTWGYTTLPADEPAPRIAGFSNQPAQAAAPTAWGYARLPAPPAESPVATRR